MTKVLKKLPPINTRRGFTVVAIGAGLLGSCAGLALYLISPSQPRSVQAAEPSLVSLEPDLSNAPLPQRQRPSASPSELDAALTNTVEPASTGFAQTYNEAGQLIDVSDIDPHQTQVEQGLDDHSGYTYPCIFSGDDQDVCQRLLTSTEAEAAGY